MSLYSPPPRSFHRLVWPLALSALFAGAATTEVAAEDSARVATSSGDSSQTELEALQLLLQQAGGADQDAADPASLRARREVFDQERRRVLLDHQRLRRESSFQRISPTAEPAALSTGLASIALAFQNLGSAVAGEPALDWTPQISGVANREFSVLVKAEGHDQSGQSVEIEPQWESADPERVTVSPTHGKTVTLTVRGPGGSNLTVQAAGIAKDLWISAVPGEGDAIAVDIVQ